MSSRTDLVSPVASHQSQRRIAPRLQQLHGRIVLSDSMLNVNAGWGGLILDCVSDALAGENLVIDRINRPQIGDHRPHEWIDRLVEQDVSALVVTAGDCATCTSRALRECILAEDAGIPATAVVPEGLHEIIQATLTAWGRPNLHVATFSTPLFALKKTDFPGVMLSTASRVKEILISEKS